MRFARLTLSLMIPVTFALGQQTQQGQFNRRNPEQGQLRFEQRLAQHLGLSSDQQSKVHAALTESRTMSQGMNEQMRTLQTSLHNAIKAGDEGQIDTVTRDISSLHQQQTAINAKATAKIYSTLTADQKTKVGEHLDMLTSGGPGFGPRGRGFGGPGRGPAQQ